MVKNLPANAGDTGDAGSILGSERSPGEGNDNPLQYCLKSGFPGGSDGNESACNVGDLGSIPGLGRSLEKGTATHSSILENSMGRGAWQATVHGVTKSQTQLNAFRFHLFEIRKCAYNTHKN